MSPLCVYLPLLLKKQGHEIWNAALKYEIWGLLLEKVSPSAYELWLTRILSSLLNCHKQFHSVALKEFSFTLVGGGTKSWIWKTQANSIVIPIYKNREKRIFEFGDRFDPPHWPLKFENPHYRVKNQSCRKWVVWPIKTCVRRALSLWNRF